MLTLPKCEFCRWFNEDTYTCKAFPEGIPADVMWKSEEEECKNGIKFENEK